MFHQGNSWLSNARKLAKDGGLFCFICNSWLRIFVKFLLLTGLMHAMGGHVTSEDQEYYEKYR